MTTSVRTMAVAGVSAAGATDPGRQRGGNEDRFHLDPAAGIFLVVDGVGGEAAGEVAAQIAVRTIANRLSRHDGAAEVRVREAITLANQDILRQARARPDRAGMSCVLTLGLLEGRRLTIGHVGDSRLYKLSRSGIAKLTHDHSPVGEREDAREITEAQAMQHARRNEVYRDVGSEPRHPDDPNFIETVVAEIEDDDAFLVCSDGLSDMLTSLEINRIVRAHAGDPDMVVHELIAAANDAGGKDNITVVFAEGPAFAHTAAPGGLVLPPPVQPVSTTPLAELVEGTPVSIAPVKKLSLARRLLRSRLLFLGLGTLVGLLSALALLVYVPLGQVGAPRRLVVGSSAAGAYQTVGEALAVARAGDTVSVEPGEYPESLLLPEGVELVARVRGTVVLVAAPGRTDWVSVTALSGTGVVRGLRIEGRETAPIHVGIQLQQGDVEIDDVTFEGAMTAAVDIGGGEGGTLRSSRFNVIGLPLRIGDGAAPSILQNVFVAGADRLTPAVEVTPDAAPRLQGNVFVRFPQPISPVARRDSLLDGNFVIPGGARR